MRWYWWALIGLAAVVAMSYSKSALAIGLQGNNPLNIKYNSKNQWLGQVGWVTGANGIRYCHFSSVEYCFRAARRLFNNYQDWYNLYTVRAMLQRYAQDDNPDSDKDQPVAPGYADFVAGKMGISPDAVIDFDKRPDMLEKMLYAMQKVEVGSYYASFDTVQQGARLA